MLFPSNLDLANILGDVGFDFIVLFLGLLSDLKFPGLCLLNPQEGGRLDAKRAAAGASAQHCTGMTNWPNTIQCLG